MTTVKVNEEAEAAEAKRAGDKAARVALHQQEKRESRERKAKEREVARKEREAADEKDRQARMLALHADAEAEKNRKPPTPKELVEVLPAQVPDSVRKLVGRKRVPARERKLVIRARNLQRRAQVVQRKLAPGKYGRRWADSTVGLSIYNVLQASKAAIGVKATTALAAKMQHPGLEEEQTQRALDKLVELGWVNKDTKNKITKYATKDPQRRFACVRDLSDCEDASSEGGWGGWRVRDPRIRNGIGTMPIEDALREGLA